MKKRRQKTYGFTEDGELITDEVVDRWVKKAEEGFDVDEMLKRRAGRPPMGSAAAAVESVRLDPELAAALRAHAERHGTTNSDVIREALRRFLAAG